MLCFNINLGCINYMLIINVLQCCINYAIYLHEIEVHQYDIRKGFMVLLVERNECFMVKNDLINQNSNLVF